ASLVPAGEAALGEGWKKVERSLCGRYPCYVEAEEPGAEMTFTFVGRRVDAYWMLASDTGKAELSLDGGEWKTVSAFDHYCLEFDRAGSAKLFDELSQEEHTLRIRVSKETDPRSKGHAIRIGAFCVM
ncbi:MAG: hypothetical protein IKZ21_00060, partial [Clostridia bacterium]|nr:hypothetical protein [Clostridia bacterium]